VNGLGLQLTGMAWCSMFRAFSAGSTGHLELQWADDPL
jgi:hypothetical protein